MYLEGLSEAITKMGGQIFEETKYWTSGERSSRWGGRGFAVPAF